MATHPPVWSLYGEFLYVRKFCNFNCWCEDLTVIEDMDLAETPPGAASESSECSTETDTDGAIVANECAESAGDPLRTDNIGCSSFQYGNPADLDCAGPMGANTMINQYSNEPLQVREFLGISGVAPQFPGYQKVQTPKSFSFGRCSISIVVLEGRYDGTDLESWDYISKRAQAIRNKCVKPHGIGGWTKGGLVDKGIGIFVHGPDSKFEDFLNAHYACVTDAEGNAECEPDNVEYPLPQRHKRPAAGEASNPPNTKICGLSQSCNSPSDCSLANECVCASDKGIPLSATWGTFLCTYAPGIIAAAAAAVQLGSDCRGRCLLGADGTFEVAATPDNTTFTSAIVNTTIFNSTTFDSTTFNPSVTDLSCPCNCTYVSKACCLSPAGLVYEDPVMKIDTVVQAPNGSVCCDPQTGNWTKAAVTRDQPLPNPACEFTTASSNSSSTGFSGINA